MTRKQMHLLRESRGVCFSTVWKVFSKFLQHTYFIDWHLSALKTKGKTKGIEFPVPLPPRTGEFLSFIYCGCKHCISPYQTKAFAPEIRDALRFLSHPSSL